MIAGIGLDLCEIERMKKAIEREAVSKALGTGLAGIGLADIEITPDAAGCPRCALSGRALDRARALCGGRFTVWVSITHEAGMAAATAILEGEVI